MTEEMRFFAELDFPSADAVAAAERALDAEGFIEHEDNVLEAEDFRWNSLHLTIRWQGSAPSSCFDITTGALAILVEHAASGEAAALNLEAEFGEHFDAQRPTAYGDHDDTEVEGDQVHRLNEHFRGEPFDEP